MRRERRRSGTTLIEVLIAVTFLAIAAAVILDAIMTANRQSAFALRRSRVLDALQDTLQGVRGKATKDSLMEGDSTVELSLPGFAESVAIKTTIQRRKDSRVLYDVSATAAWNDPSTGKRGETMTLATVVMDQ
ncbi:MAG: hypothetical protein HONBIEJF_00320 [Fimbriimonadaceae bacterium]|nr:hypothetical protein [Fimbriimonadaceae bacterium]